MTRKTKQSRSSLKRLVAGSITMLLAIGAVFAGVNVANAEAAGSVSIFSMGATTQKSGSLFAYQINAQCSGVEEGDTCENAQLFVPFEGGLNSGTGWKYTVLAGSSDHPVTGAVTNVGGREGLNRPGFDGGSRVTDGEWIHAPT